MGQRADNYFHAFNGMTLNWDAMLGSGFADAPQHWVSVYRECSLEELLRIAREGVSTPSPDSRHPDLRAELELLDRCRPAHVAKRGISRLLAISASPTPPQPRSQHRREHIIVEMRIDPEACFVGDVDVISCVLPFIDTHRHGLARCKDAFTQYWKGMMPLREFLDAYSPLETPEGTHWMLRARTRRAMQPSFFMPEVLVMLPRVSPQYVRIHKKGDITEDVTALTREPVMTWEEERE